MDGLELDILRIELYDNTLLGIIDNSTYPKNFQPSSPTLEVIPPGYNKQTIIFTPKSVNILNAPTLQIDCTDSTILPDGLYQIRYSVAPSNVNFTDYNFYKTDILESKFDEAILKTEIGQCNEKLSSRNKQSLDEIMYYIIGCKSAAKECDYILANSLYNKASDMISNFSDNAKCNC